MDFIWYFFISILGVCIGSFLNVIIHRLPVILNQAWSVSQNDVGLSLARPSSHCPSCQQKLRWYHNIPLFSFLMLKAKCAFCQQNISWRYFCIELICALVSVFLYSYFGLNLLFVSSLIFSFLLIALIAIDLEHQLLPDILTLSLLWLGLIASTVGLFVSPADAILGAATGYGGLWSVGTLYQWLTKREGMGYGDFKLLAALGAWVGWQHLPWVILLASILGSIVGITLMVTKRAGARTAIAFGPYLAIAGWIVLLWGNKFSMIFFGI